MSFWKAKSGTYEGTVRRQGMKPLHLSLRTTKLTIARERYDAMRYAVRVAPPEFIAQMRAGSIAIERVWQMVVTGETLAPLAVAVPVEPPDAMVWGTVDEVANDYLAWLEAHPNRRAQTWKLAGAQLKRFRDFEYEGKRVGDMSVDQFPRAAIMAYQQSMLAAGTPINTITTYMARVPALWRWAAADVERDSREERRTPLALYSPVDPELVVRETHRRDRVLTVAEADTLLECTPEPLLWAVACGVLAGLRAGEMLHLRPGLDVDLVLGTITIREQPDWKPKTKRSRRMIPMAPALREIAVRHQAKYASESWMLPSAMYEGQSMSPLTFRKHFIKIVERAGLTYGIGTAHGVTFHVLRHTFASHAVMRGVDLYTVSKLLGDSVKTVEDVYADLSPDHKRAAIAKLASAFTISRTHSGTETESESDA